MAVCPPGVHGASTGDARRSRSTGWFLERSDVLDFSALGVGVAGAESPDVDSDFDAFLRDSDG